MGRFSTPFASANLVGRPETSAPESQIKSCVNDVFVNWLTLPVNVINGQSSANNEFNLMVSRTQPLGSLETALDEETEPCNFVPGVLLPNSVRTDY